MSASHLFYSAVLATTLFYAAAQKLPSADYDAKLQELHRLNLQIKFMEEKMLTECKSFHSKVHVLGFPDNIFGKRSTKTLAELLFEIDLAKHTLSSWKTQYFACKQISLRKAKPCPDDFVSFEDSFYYFKSNVAQLTWDEARARCQAKSADLVTIESKEEHEFLKKNLKPITKQGTFQGWFVGGKRRPGSSDVSWGLPKAVRQALLKPQYYWVPTGKTVTYDGWKKAEGVQGDVQPDGSECMMLWIGRDDFVDYEFDDCDCSGCINTLGFICEKPNQ